MAHGITPVEREAVARRARTVLREWNGYDPTPEQAAAAGAELDRRLDALRWQALTVSPVRDQLPER